MCRNIRTLANFSPPATAVEIRASSLQFVRKLSGANKPSKANEALFDRAGDEVTAAPGRLIWGWVRRGGWRASPMHPASPSSRRLASAPAALATPPTPFFSSLLADLRDPSLRRKSLELPWVVPGDDAVRGARERDHPRLIPDVG